MLDGLHLPPLLDKTLLETFGWTLLHSMWQGALVAAWLWFVLLFVRKSQLRYVLACAALLLMILVPAVTFAILYNQPVSSAETTTITEALPSNEAGGVSEPLDVEPPQTAPRVSQKQAATPTQTLGNVGTWRQRLTTYLPYIVAIWLAGVVLLSLRLLLQWFYAERFKRRHTKGASADLQHLLRVLVLRLRVSRPVQLLESSLVDAPTVIGFLKPVILLPTSALTGLTMQQLEALLAHELAHIRRHDYFINILQSVIETLLFYHPAVWWVSSCIRTEREHCCDDVAVGVSGSAVVYAKALATLETLRSQPQLALAASNGKLVSRIKRVLGKPQRSSNWLAGLLLAALLSVFFLVSNMPEAEAQAETPETYQKQLWLSIIGPELKVTKDFPKVMELDPDNKIIFEIREGGNVKRLEVTQIKNGDQIYTYTRNGAILSEIAGTGEIMTEFINTWEIIKEWQKGAATPINETYEIPDPLPRYMWVQANGLPVTKGSFAFNAFGSSRDGTIFISYVNSAVANMALGKLSEISSATVPTDINTPPSWDWYVNSKNFRALHNILQATQVVEHGLIPSSDSFKTDFYVKNFVDDLLDNVKLSAEEMQATLELINALQDENNKKELLLKYLGKISSKNTAELGQVSTLSTNEQKLQRLLELAPELPENAASYSLYMKQAASLPDEMSQTAIREVTDSLYDRARTATVRGTGDGTAINYNGFSLVVTSKDAAAIIDFFDPFDYSSSSNELRGVAYRYRALEKGGQEQKGEGIVYENYKSIPSGEPDKFTLITSQGGDMSWVSAGPIIFEWSHGTDLGGWVYVDNLNAMLENENSFDDFNLKNIISSMNEVGLEPSTSFIPPLESAEVTTNFGELGNSVFLRAPSVEARVKAMQDGIVLDVSRLSWNDGYLVALEHANGYITVYTNLKSEGLPQKGQRVEQGDVIGYLGGGYMWPEDELKLYVRTPDERWVDPLQFLPELPNKLGSNRVYEHPYLMLPQAPVTLEATEPDIQIYVDSPSEEDEGLESLIENKNARVIPFRFDPKEVGDASLLEQAYEIRVLVQDEQGERELLWRKVPAAQVTEATFKIYGEATMQLFINNVRFMTWNP
jgi:beta-lactamase regulating signal transducer with metallopeptidase domain/murein DD-endopeptidase MepM/ murein hydrolase activator NlpD